MGAQATLTESRDTSFHFPLAPSYLKYQNPVFYSSNDRQFCGLMTHTENKNLFIKATTKPLPELPRHILP